MKRLNDAGWIFLRSKGSHHIFTHPKVAGSKIVLPHPKKDLGIGLEKELLRSMNEVQAIIESRSEA
ncbi:type II toxin-antitoxin system HicA family toxin [Geminicoccus flavidas]|uniref:type II toxin-antitoxin system HicA family toxin n=1 Tax=Geminicoccus flavidas TaxID=2506407 RepID=UPI001F2FFFFD|nr:type II toxin-antitoxin system HicA family toxin [Geminicoccus flavidas]